MTPVRILVIAVGLVTAVAVSAQEAADWSTFRGPRGDGISTDAAWDPAALAAGPKIAWKAAIGTGFSSVSIVGQQVYAIGNEAGQDVVRCLDAKTGAETWKYSYKSKSAGGGSPGPRATPLVHGGNVYTVGSEGHLFCLDAQKGTVKWSKHLVSDFQTAPPSWGYSATPLIQGNLLLVNAGVNGAALDAATGAKVWASAGKGGYAVPVVFDRSGKKAVAIFSENSLAVANLADGTPLWTHPWKTGWDVNAADPIVSGGQMFISSGYDHGCALLDVTGPQPRVLWENKNMRNHFSSCVLLNGYIYGIDGNAGKGDLRCLDWKTGEPKWTQKTGFGSLIAVAGKLIVLNEKGTLYVAEATPAGYKELSQGKIALEEKYWTTPAFSRGKIYCRDHKGPLICVDVGK